MISGKATFNMLEAISGELSMSASSMGFALLATIACYGRAGRA
jgi:hypothetical protein